MSAVPTLLMVTVRDVLEAELMMLPKTRDAGVAWTIGSNIPVPEMVTSRIGATGALLLIRRLALLAPLLVGVKVTFTVQLPPGAMVGVKL
jgi:hypothetical protein